MCGKIAQGKQENVTNMKEGVWVWYKGWNHIVCVEPCDNTKLWTSEDTECSNFQ